MARLIDIIEYINSKFTTKDLDSYSDESGATYDAGRDVKIIGYASNLTPDVIRKAVSQNVDLIMTHHDAWHFIFGLKEDCRRLLEKHNISHYFNHLPLDDAKFGTNSSITSELCLDEIEKGCDYKGYKCAVIAEYKVGVPFKEFVSLVESKLDEKVLSWKFNDRLIKKVFIVCGAGHWTTDVLEAVNNNCDIYLTGEKILYTVEYAKLHNINLVVGSHTFIEFFGVKNMAKLTAAGFDDVDTAAIIEEHLESDGMH